jgi:inhibitor of KinA
LDAVFLCAFEKTYLNRVNVPRIYRLSECAMTMELGDNIEPGLNRLSMALYDGFRRDPFPGFLEAVPAYASLTIFFNPQALRKTNPGDTAAATVQGILWTRYRALAGYAGEDDPEIHEIPVCYDPSFGTDLSWVADFCGLSAKEVIERHCSPLYRVYLVGFVPGFPYLGITDPAIDVPRKTEPSIKVPRGSVALAGRQTGIYPADIPGGWQVIGRTPLSLFDPTVDPCTLLRAGMTVRFNPVSLDAYNRLAHHGTAHS